ncbi:MAG: hypothetical protein K2Y37_00830 [Pirellulales bacterium]|nr:hypothetical protein [Pirellulales bacterium]
MSELLARECNAAIPVVDIGTDVFAFRDSREDVARIQVKTAHARSYKREHGFTAKFNIPIKQLNRADPLPLYYALAVRLRSEWTCFVVIGRVNLQQLWNQGLGSETAEELHLHLQFRPNDSGHEPRLRAQCGEVDLTEFINAWESLPPLRALPELP